MQLTPDAFILLLLEHSACAPGLEAARRALADVPSGAALDLTTPWSQGLILSDAALRPFFGWLVTEGIIPLWSMAGADLEGANLEGAHLSGANLEGADLEGALGYTP